MIFIIPFIIGAIGVAVGALGGASAAKASVKKDKQKAKHLRKINNDLINKYSKLQKRYDEYTDKSKTEIVELNHQLILGQIREDALHLVIELQSEVIQLIVEIDEYPSFNSIENLQKAIAFTNLALAKFDKELIELPDDYIHRNLNRALEGTTNDYDRSHYFYLYGQIFRDEGKHQEAIQNYNRSIQIGHFNEFAYLEKSKSLIELGKYQEAILTLNLSLSIDTNNAEIWSVRALAYSLLENHSEATKNYQHTLVAAPNYYQVCYDNGFFCEEKGEKLQAIKYYDQAIKMKPDFAEAYYRRGILLLGFGDPLSNLHYDFYKRKGKDDLELAKKLFIEQNKEVPKPEISDNEYQIIFGSLLIYGMEVAIQACNGKYIMSKLNDSGKLWARAEQVKAWEKFEIIYAEEPLLDNKTRIVKYGEKVALRSTANKKFVSSDLNNHGRLIASVPHPHIKEWETFTLLPVKDDDKLGKIIEYEDKFTLRVHSSKQVYCRIKERGRICIDSNRTDGSEVFIFVKPSN